MKSADERNHPEFFRIYASGERDAALALARSLGFSVIDAMWVVRKAESGADLATVREIVLTSPAYADLAEDFWRQQDDFWAVVAEHSEEFERVEDGTPSVTFCLQPSRWARARSWVRLVRSCR